MITCWSYASLTRELRGVNPNFSKLISYCAAATTGPKGCASADRDTCAEAGLGVCCLYPFSRKQGHQGVASKTFRTSFRVSHSLTPAFQCRGFLQPRTPSILCRHPGPCKGSHRAYAWFRAASGSASRSCWRSTSRAACAAVPTHSPTRDPAMWSGGDRQWRACELHLPRPSPPRAPAPGMKPQRSASAPRR